MKNADEVKAVRDGLLSRLWATVDGEDTEHTEILARIDTLNWVLEPSDRAGHHRHSVEVEHPRAEEEQDPEPPDAPVAARETISDSMDVGAPVMAGGLIDSVGSGMRSTFNRIMFPGGVTPTTIIELGTESPQEGAGVEVVQRQQVTTP